MFRHLNNQTLRDILTFKNNQKIWIFRHAEIFQAF